MARSSSAIIRRRWLDLRITALFALLLLLCGLPVGTASAFQPVYIMGSSSMGGTYYQLAGIIAEAVNDKVPGVRLAVQPTGGTAENIDNLEKGLNQFALTDSLAVMAYEGRDLYYERPQTYLGAVMPLYPEVARLLVPAGSPVRSLSDLAGRRVAVGRKGSGVLVTARQILEASGLRSDAVHPVYLGMGEGLLALRDGTVDASPSWANSTSRPPSSEASFSPFFAGPCWDGSISTST